MAKDKAAATFACVGDVEVGGCVSALLADAGFVEERASQADAVFSYHANLPALEDAYYDSEGLLQVTKPGAILVDLSPATASFARELNAVALVNDRLTVDAPLVVRAVVAPDAFADAENLGIVAGADEAVFRRVEPMLSAIACQVSLMGGPGAGQCAKVATTLASAAALVGIVEAYASLGSNQLAVDGERLAGFWASCGLTTPAQEAFVSALAGDSFEGRFTLEHLMGELAAALSSVDDGDLILPQAEAGFRLMELLALVGGVERNPAALKLVFSDEETSARNGLDWSRAEGAYEGHGCDCGHDHGEGGCSCGHHHDHGDDAPSGYVSFSSN